MGHSGEEQHVDDGAEGMRHILSTRSGGPVESGGSERRSGARWGQSAGVVEVRGAGRRRNEERRRHG